MEATFERVVLREAPPIIRELHRREECLPAPIEATWEAWSRNLRYVDGRTIALLRAAFELGVRTASGDVVQRAPDAVGDDARLQALGMVASS